MTRDALGEDAFELALRLLARRDYAARDLERRLAGRGLSPAATRAALGQLHEHGLLDDARYARGRAAALAARGAGNALIRHDLERSGVALEEVEEVLASLEPERVRAEAIVRRRGGGPRTARYLRSKGFDDELVRVLVARGREHGLG